MQHDLNLNMQMSQNRLMYMMWVGYHSLLVNLSCPQFVTAEALIVAVTDLYPKKLAGSPNKEIFTAVACGVWFLIGLTMVTEVRLSIA